MATPPRILFRDINLDTKLPLVTDDMVEGYVLPHRPSFDGRYIEERYIEKHIMSMRSLHINANNSFFISAQVQSSMKATSYFVDMCLRDDGTVQESQCECVAGMGPDSVCNHRILVLHALTEHGKKCPIITQETGTQRLQTFHAVKPHKGKKNISFLHQFFFKLH